MKKTHNMQDMQDKVISGYTLKKLLGKGGMAEVWYAENNIGKTAAVKILLPKLCEDQNVMSRFRTEAMVMVGLNHPNIRQVYDYGEIDGRPAIVMEYLEGDDLKERMKRGQRFSEADLEKWWNQLIDALNYTHQKGVVHRDIKPGNIFVDYQGNIKLLDFGIAKVRESISSTQTGQKLGTLMYMSPEQVKDSKHIDYRTDVYSLAVTFVNLITGKKPYDTETSSDFDISEQIVYKPLDLSGLPYKWQQFLQPYLSKNPSERKPLQPFASSGAVNHEMNNNVFGSDNGDEETQLDGGYQTSGPSESNRSSDSRMKVADSLVKIEIEDLCKYGKYKEAYNKCLSLIKQNREVEYANKKIEELVPVLQKESKKKGMKGVIIGIGISIVVTILYVVIMIACYS